MTTLLERIRTREAKVVVVGAGYVGLPLAVEVAKAGFKITAYDKSVEKVQSLGRGISYVNDVSSETLAPLVEAGTLDASAEPDVLVDGGRRHHLRPHAAQQDEGSGQLVHHGRGGDAGAADEAAAAGRPREHHLPRLHPRSACSPGSCKPAASPTRTSSWPSRRSGSIRGTRSSSPTTPPRCWAASRRRASRWRRRCTATSSRRSSRCRRPTAPRWSSCWRTPSAPSTSASSTRWRSCAGASASTPGR